MVMMLTQAIQDLGHTVRKGPYNGHHYIKLLCLISWTHRIFTEYCINILQIWLTHSALALCLFWKRPQALDTPYHTSLNSTVLGRQYKSCWRFHWEVAKVLYIWQHQATYEKMPIWCLCSSQKDSFLIFFSIKPYFSQIYYLLIRNLAASSFSCPNDSKACTEPKPPRKALYRSPALFCFPKYAPCTSHASLMSASFREARSVLLPQRLRSFWRRF